MSRRMQHLLQSRQTQQVESCHLQGCLVLLGETTVSCLHQSLNYLESDLTGGVVTQGHLTAVLMITGPETQIHCIVVVTVTLHTQINSHDDDDDDEKMYEIFVVNVLKDDLFTGRVCFPEQGSVSTDLDQCGHHGRDIRNIFRAHMRLTLAWRAPGWLSAHH